MKMGDARAWQLPLRVSAGLAVIAGLLLFVGATRTDDYFSWTIAPPLTAAFLGAAYWAAAVLFLWASAQRDWPTIRIAALPEVTVAVLLLLATQLHLEKFHSNVFGYFWVAVYAIAAPVLIYLLVTHGGGRSDPAPGAPMPNWLRLLLGAQAALFGVYGIGLFLSPSGFGAAWPWPLTPLTAQAVASFLLGFGLAAAIAAWGNDLRRFRGAALAYTVLGGFELLAALLHSGDFDGGLALPAFLLCAASVLTAGLAGARLDAGPQASRSRRARSGS
jgi:peptidoglycan/LPS O-acetylase OafA/YrhL